MRAILVLAALVVLALIAAVALGLIDVSQTQQAKLPSVEVKGGQLPEFDADVADVDVSTANTTVNVPTVDVGTSKEKVELPTVDVDQKADAGK